MKSNYDLLGNHIQLVDERNGAMLSDRVLGINIDKFFMPSVANVIGTDLSKYKLITQDALLVILCTLDAMNACLLHSIRKAHRLLCHPLTSYLR